METYWEESISGPPRKYYRITEIGKANYREMLLEWQEFSSAVNRFLEGVDQHD